jgi:hypothetical protein
VNRHPRYTIAARVRVTSGTCTGWSGAVAAIFYDHASRGWSYILRFGGDRTPVTCFAESELEALPC